MSELEDRNVLSYETLITPRELKGSCGDLENGVTKETREKIEAIMERRSDKFLVVVGPCSIHDERVALEYAEFVREMNKKFGSRLVIVMRTYFTKPRTTVGWKGYLYDPDLNGSMSVNKGLVKTREILEKICGMGVACGMEHLDNITPQYFDDLLSWSAIGARSIESQIHRELSSGVSCPVGMKNTTSGGMSGAVHGVLSARARHTFLGCDKDGKISKVTTKGNKFCHVILRGSDHCPNYESPFVRQCETLLVQNRIDPRIMIDCSHGNSYKDYRRQGSVLANVMDQIKAGDNSIFGVMLESNINEGRQDISKEMKYGVSVTDSCIGIRETEDLLEKLYNTISNKRVFSLSNQDQQY